MHVSLKSTNGVIKQSKVGFSWTVLLFAFFPPLFRGDIKWAAIIFVSAMLVGLASGGLLAWLPSVVVAFIYNKLYIQDLIRDGFQPADDTSRDILRSKGIIG